MKNKSIITPPPPMPELGQVVGGDSGISEEERKAALLKLIRKGAPSVPQTDKERAAKRAVLYVRLDQKILERARVAAKGHRLQIPLNTWVTEAILEKLTKEGFGG